MSTRQTPSLDSEGGATGDRPAMEAEAMSFGPAAGAEPSDADGADNETIESQSVDLDAATDPVADPDPTDGSDGEFSALDELLIECLGMRLSQRRTSKVANVSVRLIQRRLDKPEFSEAVKRRLREVNEELLGGMTAAAGEAVGVVRDAMSVDQPMRIRLDGAGKALRGLQNVRNEAAIEERIAELEKSLAEMVAVFAALSEDVR